MKSLFAAAASVLLLLCAIECAPRLDRHSFDGYKLVKINLQSREQSDLVEQLRHNDDFDLWNNKIKGFDNETVSVLLSPDAYAKYTPMLDSAKMNYQIAVPNFEELLLDQETNQNVTHKRNFPGVVGNFARYNDILQYINAIVSGNPSLASSYSAGRTYENRDLRVLVLKTPTAKRSVFIDCGIHAREWISPSTCIWIIDKLVNDYKNNVPAAVKVLNYFEIHILPLLNPDGYEYSHTSYRMWRKNRRPNSGSSCVGVDLNRNSGFHWMVGGASSNPCSDIYAGPSQDSELEIRGLQNALKRKSNWDSYLTLHSYGQWWFTTWGYTTSLPSDFYNQVEKARVGVNAIRAVNGISFTLDSSARLLGVAAGGSEDWAKGVLGIPYAFCLEMRPGQSGPDSHYGFALPSDRIPLAGEEVYQGIRAFLNGIAK